VERLVSLKSAFPSCAFVVIAGGGEPVVPVVELTLPPPPPQLLIAAAMPDTQIPATTHFSNFTVDILRRLAKLGISNGEN
jgi:hypothetical protein